MSLRDCISPPFFGILAIALVLKTLIVECVKLKEVGKKKEFKLNAGMQLENVFHTSPNV